MEQINDYLGILIQTSGIFIALIFVIAAYRMQTLRDLLVGHGRAVYLREKEGLYTHLKDFFKKQGLSHTSAVNRLDGFFQLRELFGIEEILIRYTQAELDDSEENNKQIGDTGFFKGVLPIFIKTKFHYRFITWFAVILLGIFSASISIELITNVKANGWTFLNTIIILIGIGLFLLFMFVSLFKKVGQEKENKKKVKALRAKYSKINELYKENNRICKLFC